MIPDIFFILSFFFLLGLLSAYFNLFFVLSFLLILIFYIKFKNFKLTLLSFLFFLLGFFYFLLREEIKIDFSDDFVLPYRNFLEEKIKESLPFRESNLLSGVLFGSKFEDSELKQYLTLSGLSHITAVSGHNLTIMLSLAYEVLISLRFLTPNLLFLFSNFLIIFFVLIMGFQGSVLRAGIMSFFLYLSKAKFGRVPLKRNILMITALIFTLLDPLLLLKDIGTQLSFLAMIGILYLAPLIERKFSFSNFLSKAFSEIFAAQILTLPLILYYFGNYNLFSFFANILTVPFLPILLLFGYLLVIFPFNFLVWLSFPILKYLIFVSETFSNFGVFYLKIPLIFVLTFYIFIFYEIYSKLKNEIPDFRLNFS